jgi:hypothetical protein
MKKPFRVWDIKQLGDAYVITEQIRAQIEMLFMNLDASSLNDIPHSMVPTETLYHIVSGYGLLYDAVLDYDLIKTGNTKQDHKSH